MVQVSYTNNLAIDKLKQCYLALPWYQKRRGPKNFEAILLSYDRNKPEIAWAVCIAFLNNAIFFHQDFFSSLHLFHDTSLSYAISQLYHANLSVGDSGKANLIATLVHEEPEKVADALMVLNNVNLLSVANCNAVAAHKNPEGVAFAIRTLNRAHLLTEANRDAIVSHQNPEVAAFAIKEAARVRASTTDNVVVNRYALLSHPNLERPTETPGLFNAMVSSL